MVHHFANACDGRAAQRRPGIILGIDEDNCKVLMGRQHLLDQLPVARLEDVQGHQGVGKEYRPWQREDGQGVQGRAEQFAGAVSHVLFGLWKV